MYEPPDLDRHIRRLPWWAQSCLALGLTAWTIVEIERFEELEVVGGFWVTLALFAASTLLKILTAETPEDEEPEDDEFDGPTALEGRVIPLMWGRVKVTGPNVVDYFDVEHVPLYRRIKKYWLFGTEWVVVGYQRRVGVQFALVHGANVELMKIYIAEKLAKDLSSSPLATDAATTDIDLPDFFGGTPSGLSTNDGPAGTNGVKATCVWYTGSSLESTATPQTPDPYLGKNQAVGGGSTTHPPYRDTAYLVAHELGSSGSDARGAYLGDFNQIQPWAFELRHYVEQFPGQFGTDPEKITDEVNPANVIYQLLTNTDWGMGFPAADIDAGTSGSSFVQAGITLKNEGNGFSMLLDKETKHVDFLKLLQKHIDGTVYLDRRTGKWKIKLNRNDYNIDTVPQLTDANVVKVDNFTRPTWQETINTVRVTYKNRNDDYQEGVKVAQDMANALIRGQGTVGTMRHATVELNFPGVKLEAPANNIAWRELRQRSYPLARARVQVDRTFWDLNMGDVVAFTNSALGVTKIAMRVAKIDIGDPRAEVIKLDLVQDVFQFAAASYGEPGGTKWNTPTPNLVVYPSDEQLAYEAPRALIVRDPNYNGAEFAAKVHCSARKQGTETQFQVEQRNDTTAPSGGFTDEMVIAQFMHIGELKNNLAAGTAIPTASILLTTAPTAPSTQTQLETAFDDSTSVDEIGQDLVHLIRIGTDSAPTTGGDEGEFALVSAANNNGADVELTNVYRGVLGTAQQDHTAGDPVFLVFLGSGLTTTTFPNTNFVDLRYRAQSLTDEFSGTVTDISLRLNKRALRPYPPGTVYYNGSGTSYNTPDLEGDGAGLNGVGFTITGRRRRYNTLDEIAEFSADQSVTASTEHRVRVNVDPSGSNVEVHDSGWFTGAISETPTQAFVVNEAAAGTEIRVRIDVRHDIETETNLEGEQFLFHDVNPTSARTSQFYLGGDLSSGVASNIYTVADAGVHTVNIGAGYTTANVQERVNGGSWATIIAGGTGTSGSTSSLSVSDTFELRVDANESPARNFVELVNPSAADVAYGVLTDGT